MKNERNVVREKADRHTWRNSDAVKITFPDGTVMIGDKVVRRGRDAIVEGDKFIRWNWKTSSS